jgi:hypothetical protein
LMRGSTPCTMHCNITTLHYTTQLHSAPSLPIPTSPMFSDFTRPHPELHRINGDHLRRYVDSNAQSAPFCVAQRLQCAAQSPFYDLVFKVASDTSFILNLSLPPSCRILTAAFQQRRKMMRQSLKGEWRRGYEGLTLLPVLLSPHHTTSSFLPPQLCSKCLPLCLQIS